MYRGWLSENSINRRIYDTWYDMLKRCYGKRSSLKSPSYKDCTVAREWLSLSNFVKDIPYLENYEEWLASKYKGWALDKDIKVPGNKEYSKDTTSFVSQQNNNLEMNDRTHLYDIQIIKDSKLIHTCRGLQEASLFVQRSPQSCCDVINGRSKTVNGYFLRKKI